MTQQPTSYTPRFCALAHSTKLKLNDHMLSNFQALKIPRDEKPCNKEPLNGHYEPTPTSAPSTRCLL
jgi:hypothetical protein